MDYKREEQSSFFMYRDSTDIQIPGARIAYPEKNVKNNLTFTIKCIDK